MNEHIRISRFPAIARQAMVITLLATALVVTAAVGRAEIAPAVSPAACDMIIQDGRLSAYIENTPLADVLEQVSALTGAVVRVSRSTATRRVSAQVSDLSLLDGLTAILRGTNVALVSKRTTNGELLTEIWVLGSGSPRRVDQERYPAAEPTEVQDDPIAEDTVVTEPTIDQEAIDRFAQVAQHAEKPAKRIEALGALMTHGGADARVQAILMEAQSDADPTVREAAAELVGIP